MAKHFNINFNKSNRARILQQDFQIQWRSLPSCDWNPHCRLYVAETPAVHARSPAVAEKMRALNVSPTIVRKKYSSSITLNLQLYADDSTYFFIHFILVTLTQVTSTSSLYGTDVLCICFTCKRIESDFWAIIADFQAQLYFLSINGASYC